MNDILAETRQLDNTIYVDGGHLTYKRKPGIMCIVHVEASSDVMHVLLSQFEQLAISKGCWAITAELDCSDPTIDQAREFGMKDVYLQTYKKI